MIAWLLGNLDHPSIKPRLLALLAEHAGLAIDYDALDVSLRRGVHARAFRLQQPPKFRATAPDFVRIDTLDVDTSLSDLLGGLHIALVRVTGVDVTVVADDRGATTLSELFPAQPEPAAPEPTSPLSHALVDLPTLRVDRVAISDVRGRLIARTSAAVVRTTSLGTLALSGAVRMQPASLDGTTLALRAPALRLEVDEAGRRDHAELGAAVTLKGAAGGVALSVESDLRTQSWSPAWPQHTSPLLALAARVAFEPQKERTTIGCPSLRGLGQVLTGDLALEIGDGAPARLTADGKLAVALDRLPLGPAGLTVEALSLALSAERLALHGDRIEGVFALRGGVKRVAFERDGASAQLDDVHWSGTGTLAQPTGQFDVKAQIAALSARAPTGAAKLADAKLALAGRTAQTGGAQQVDATLTLGLPTSELTAPGQTLALSGTALSATLAGAFAALREGRIPKLDGKLDVAQITAISAQQRALLERTSLRVAGSALAPSDASPSGLQGNAQVRVALPSLQLFAGGSGAPPARRVAQRIARRPTLAIQETLLEAQVPLALAKVTGKLSVASLRAEDAALERLAFDLTLDHAAGWAPDARGPATMQLKGGIAALRDGDNRGVLDDLTIAAERLDAQRYRLALDATGSSLGLTVGRVPERVTCTVRADADASAPTVKATAELHGARGAEVKLALDAAFTRATGRLRYEASIAAEKLEAFAPLFRSAAPSAAGVQVAGARLAGSARGDLAGVLRATRDGMPTLAPDPLETVRGEQSASVELTGLDYQVPDLSLAAPALSLTLESVHRDGGAGRAELRVRADTVRYAGGGTSVHLKKLDQRVTATYDRPPDEGLVDVRAALALGALSQSVVPAYQIADLSLRSHLQVERLRSFFLRELIVENPEAGTSLTARGAIELPTRMPKGGEKTIVGREALALEGSVEQALEPLKKLDLASHASGRISIPFRLESGGLLGYRLLAALEAKQVSFAMKDQSLAIEALDGRIPIIEEFALLPSGVVVSSGPRESPLTETRFFDVHPFLQGEDYVTARTIKLGAFSALGPFAANVRVDRSDFLIDQLEVGWSGGQIVGQVRVAYRDGDPLVRVRLNATGVRSGKSQDVLDANASLTLQPRIMTVDGKVQLVRVSRAHLYDILDLIDPYRDSASANRVRQALTLGYPKFVRFALHDGAVDTKVELGGIAQVVRIDEIKAVPLGPILQRYVVPTVNEYLHSEPDARPEEVAAKNEEESP